VATSGGNSCGEPRCTRRRPRQELASATRTRRPRRELVEAAGSRRSYVAAAGTLQMAGRGGDGSVEATVAGGQE
jgi:hypothetical protein